VTRQFATTNVLVYAYATIARDRHEVARQLARDSGESQTGAHSVQVLQDLYVTLTRKAAVPVPPAKGRRLRGAAPAPSDLWGDRPTWPATR
jgi:predicted nucleic acid-binding protein